MDAEALQALVDEVSRLLGAPATLEDRAFRLLAYGSQPATVDVVRQTSIMQRVSPEPVRTFFEQFGIASADGPVRTPADPEQGIAARLCLPCRWGGVTHGYLWLLDQELPGREPELRAAMELAERAGRLLAQEGRQQRAREGRLVALIGADRGAGAQAAIELVEQGRLRAGEQVVVAAVRWTGDADPERAPVEVHTASLPGSVLAASVPGHTALLVPVRDASGPATVRELIGSVLSEHPGTVAGVGGPRDLREAHQSWAQARQAAHVAAHVPMPGRLAQWSALGAYRLLSVATPAALAEAVLDDGVRALLDNPDDRLATTARCYLEHAGSAKDTAAVLQVHRQTLYYRLQRVEQVTGLDLGNGEDRLRLHLALLLGPVLREP